MSLADQDVEELSQLLSPLHTETHEVLLWPLSPSIWCQLVGVEILQASEGGHEGVGVSPSHRDPVQLPSQHVGGPIKAAWNNNKKPNKVSKFDDWLSKGQWSVVRSGRQ